MRKLVAMKLLDPTIAQLDAAADRLGRSRAATVEILINLYANTLGPNTMIPAGAIPKDSRMPGQQRRKINSDKSDADN